jgi:hypothetical protein
MNVNSSYKEKFKNFKNVIQSSYNDVQSEFSQYSHVTKKENNSVSSDIILKFNFPHLSNFDTITFDYNSISSACPIYRKKLNLRTSNGFHIEKVLLQIKKYSIYF